MYAESGVHHMFQIKQVTPAGMVDIQPEVLVKNFNLQASIVHYTNTMDFTDLPIVLCKELEWTKDSRLPDKVQTHFNDGEVFWCFDETKADLSKQNMADDKWINVTFGQCQLSNTKGIKCENTIKPSMITFQQWKVDTHTNLEDYDNPWRFNDAFIMYSFGLDRGFHLYDFLNKMNVLTDTGKFMPNVIQSSRFYTHNIPEKPYKRSDTSVNKAYFHLYHGKMPEQDFMLTMQIMLTKEEVEYQRSYMTI